MNERELRKARFEFNRYGFNPIERIWRVANRKRTAERQAKHDELITAAIRAHVCVVDVAPWTDYGILCGAPLDDDGLCPEHE